MPERKDQGIETFLHCAKCLREKPDWESPETWARLSVGVTKNGDIVRVWCVRHDCLVADLSSNPAAVGPTPKELGCAQCDHEGEVKH